MVEQKASKKVLQVSMYRAYADMLDVMWKLCLVEQSEERIVLNRAIDLDTW